MFFSWKFIDINENFLLSHNVFETRGYKTNSHLLYACFEKRTLHGMILYDLDDIL